MLSQSPPIFSHSPPVSFLSDFMSSNHQGISYNDESNKTPRYSLPQVITLASKARVNNASSFGQNRSNGPNMRYGKTYLERMVSAPDLSMQPKSCLIRKSCLCKSKTSSSVTVKDTHDTEKSSRRIQKKVIFADDEGLSLTEVRVMSEPSNVPPYWSVQFLEQITQGLVSPHPADQWTVDFKQPASDYLSFRHKIDTNFVSLENVIVKDEESIVVGTVKVKNISFKKEIIVRVTWDNWKSQQDIFCTFARAYGPTTCSHVVFDTFSFKITLPPSSKLLEFCICFRAEDQEYWDNNNGKNYTISKRSPLYYNALSPYDKSPPRYNCLSQTTSSSSIPDTFEPTIEEQLDNTPSPYW